MAGGMPVCVIGKTGVGYCAICRVWTTGRITSGSDDCLIAGSGVARDSDTVKASCGHIGYIHASMTTKKINGKGIARLSDVFTGDFTGVLIDGVQTVAVG
ncbi:hypothetical protein [Desulfatirhabdium butyrativorans]|uniref:hypothetical protein n=1 Tax=Desulfatirhabdium butyrativorans TaxID=340467 RepID=UPI0004166F18|nr:hypothetical protein [Desulfatirhabdium butyrativorans]